MHIDPAVLKEWIGREETADDLVGAAQVAGLAAVLDRDDPPPAAGDPLPPGWHWLFCIPRARQSALGPDGHPARGGFLPPVPLPRRMWAGGSMTFHKPLRLGEPVRRRSVVEDVTLREGRGGPLVFVRVRHEISGPGGLATVEDQDIVYREAARPDDPPPAPDDTPPPVAVWQRTVVPDAVLLFRFSALTFNGHRIHYDRDWATAEEGYPGLVVHGPLLAILLLDLWRRESGGVSPASFAFRARRPLFDTAPFTVCGAAGDPGDPLRLWVRGPDGNAAMTAGLVPAE